MKTSALGDRPRGALIGACVSGAVAATSVRLDWPLTVIAAFGIPIGAFLGYAMAPSVIAARSVWRPAIVSAVASVSIGAVGFLTGWVVAGWEPTLNVLWLLWIVGFAFVLGMPVALPVALVSAALLRRIARRWPVEDPRILERALDGAAEPRS